MDDGRLFSILDALHDSERFFSAERGGTTYVFDSRLNDFFELSGAMGRLYAAASPDERSSLLTRPAAGDLDDEARFLDQVAGTPEPSFSLPARPGAIRSLQISAGTECNLSCRYCFRERNPRRMTDPSLIDRAIRDLVFRYGADAVDYVVCFDLASEPLLQLPLLEYVSAQIRAVEKQAKKPIGLFFITNGTVNETRVLKRARRLRSGSGRYMNVSLDGPREVHDALRVDRHGNGTWDTVMKTLRSLRSLRIPVAVEGVITDRFPFPGKIVAGYLDLDALWIRLKPVRSGTPFSFTMESVESLKAGYEEYFHMLYDDLRGGGGDLLRVLKDDCAVRPLQRILCRQPSTRRCFWGVNVLAMDHEGDYYPCSVLVGRKEFKIGDVADGVDFTRYNRDLSCLLREPCRRCWARFLCGGTCHVNSLIAAGDVMAVDPVECALSKYLAERNLLLVYDLLRAGLPKMWLEEMARKAFA